MFSLLQVSKILHRMEKGKGMSILCILDEIFHEIIVEHGAIITVVDILHFIISPAQ